MIYIIAFILLFILELIYFKIAAKLNIVDKPNIRGSNTDVVLCGGGIIFTIAVLVWMCLQAFNVQEYLPFVTGLILAAGVSFIDDVKSVPIKVRLVVQFVAMIIIMYGLGVQNVIWFKEMDWYWQVLMGIAALIVFVGATNVYNFMDGINGMTGVYSLSIIIPLIILNEELGMSNEQFVEPSLLIIVMLSVLVFCFFNFRKEAKCFAGDVGSIGIALILLFCIGKLMLKTGDMTWLVLLVVYGVDGCLTIVHRMMLHENLGQAHRKHAYQLMANELGMSHVKVSLIYACIQLAISLGFIYIVPNTIMAHWIYLVSTLLILSAGYVIFMRKYYHLHEEYLASLKAK